MSSTPPPPPPPGDGSEPTPPQEPNPAYGQAPTPPPAYSQPTYGQPAYGAPGGARPGELLDRFVARLIDGVLLSLVNGLLISAILLGAILGMDSGPLGGGTIVGGIVGAILSTALYLGYFGYLESTRGQTLGKMVMKLRTVGPEGGNPTMEQAIRRNIFMGFGLLGVVPIIGGIIGGVAQLVAVVLIAVGINGDTVHRQAWHDRFAGGTRVVKEG